MSEERIVWCCDKCILPTDERREWATDYEGRVNYGSCFRCRKSNAVDDCIAVLKPYSVPGPIEFQLRVLNRRLPGDYEIEFYCAGDIFTEESGYSPERHVRAYLVQDGGGYDHESIMDWHDGLDEQLDCWVERAVVKANELYADEERQKSLSEELM